MVKLSNSYAFMMEPIPPYNFKLTIKKPAGWPLFTPFEVYEKRNIWTATSIYGRPVGIKIASRGTTEHPKMAATIFVETIPVPEE